MHSTKQHVSRSLASLATFRNLALMVAVLAVATALILISTTTQAQASNGAVPNLQLSSASPGELTITWDAPDPAPSDYRIIWAEQSLDFLSYSRPNEANRGNEYPSGDETSITLTGLTKGATFKVKSRTRYTSGGENNGPWSGPWTDTVTARVKNDPPAAPTGLTTSGVAHDSVTISWAAPSQGTVTSYRVMRGTETGSLSTIEEDTGNINVEYTDSTVAAETTYYYAVLALSQDGDGAQSTTVSATTPAEAQPVPSSPTGLTTSGVAHDSVTIGWTTPSKGSVTGYRILRGTDSNSLSAIVQNTDSTATEYHGLHRGRGDHLLLRSPGSERGRGRGPVRRRQCHHSGGASTDDGPRSPAQQHDRWPTHHFLGRAQPISVRLPDRLGKARDWTFHPTVPPTRPTAATSTPAGMRHPSPSLA